MRSDERRVEDAVSPPEGSAPGRDSNAVEPEGFSELEVVLPRTADSLMRV